MIDRDVLLVLMGAGITLITSLAVTTIQHFLSLRAERKRIEWEEEFKERHALRESLKPLAFTIAMSEEKMDAVIDQAKKMQGSPRNMQVRSRATKTPPHPPVEY